MAAQNKIQIPTWLVTLLVAAALGVACDAWRSLQCVKTDLRTLTVALKAKGIIERDLCVIRPNNAKLRCFDGQFANQANQSSKTIAAN